MSKPYLGLASQGWGAPSSVLCACGRSAGQGAVLLRPHPSLPALLLAALLWCALQRVVVQQLLNQVHVSLRDGAGQGGAGRAAEVGQK